ncbi:hypothetical protein GQ457_10G004680 [Hibiscus cannabinus]
MASSSKKPKEENKKKEKSKTEKPEKKASTPQKSNKSKPKPDKSRKKSSNGTPGIPDPSSSTESNENKTQKNVKPNNKRKRKEKEEENGGGGGGGGEATVCRFPMNRIKRIIKSEDSSVAISQDVVFLVNKATEMFLEKFSEDGYKCSVKDRKKSLSYKHLATVAHERKRYDFLSDYVPQKIKAEDALKEMNSTETGKG